MIPGVETYHRRSVWEPNGVDPWYGNWLLRAYGDLRRDSAFHRRPPELEITKVTRLAVHYTAAVNLPDGDPGEILTGIDGIRALLARSTFDYLSNRSGGGYERTSDGHWFKGYPLGYSFAIDWLGGVWEIQGWDYRPAATSGWNNSTLAILMLTDRADPATDLAWQSFRALAAEAKRRGARITPESVWSHGWFYERTGTGTPTGCCGDALEAQIEAGAGDWTVTPLPPEEHNDMARINGFFVKFEGRADHFLCIPQTGDSKARLEPDAPRPILARVDSLAELEDLAGYPLTPE